MTVTNEQEQVVCDFLRELCPGRDWTYLGEVEHLWIAEMVGAITATVGAGTCKLVIEKRPRHGPWIYHFECGYDFWQPTDCPMPILKHCPNCGARIKKEAE